MSRRWFLGPIGLLALACAGLPGQGDGATGAPPAPGGPAPAEGAASGAGTLPSNTLPPDALHLKKITIMDSQGYAQPVPAFSFLVPHDWKAEGGVQWAGNAFCPENVVQPWARAESPDGSLGFEIFPPLWFTWDTDPQTQQLHQQAVAMGGQGCPYMPSMSAADFLQTQLLPARRPGAQVLAAEPMTQVTQAMDRTWTTLVQQLRSQGSQARYQVDASRVRIRSGDREEWISASVVTLSNMVMPGFSNAEVQTSQAAWMFAVRAPAGQLDQHERLLATIVASYRAEPRWQAAITRFTTGIRNAQIKSLQEIGRIYRETNDEIMAMNQESWRRSQATGDRVAESFSQYLRDVDEWKDPQGDEVELDAGYDFAWSNGNDEYIVTQDANWNPNVGLHETGWEQMERQR